LPFCRVSTATDASLRKHTEEYIKGSE
jgi:hypothetical protein